MRCSYYPNVLLKFVERFGRSRFGFGGADLRVLFIPSCPGYTGLTGALDRSNRCEPFVGLASGDLLDSCVFRLWCWVSSWSVWSCLDRFGVGFSFRAGCVWVVFLFQGLEKSLRLSGTLVVQLL
jgi:hypothetical protein